MKQKWIWTEPLKGTQLFPHHRRWDCRLAIIAALRWLDEPTEAARFLGRAVAFNAIMFDYHDPLASAYARRIQKIHTLIAEKGPTP
jgi:hypothetical protein